MYILIRANSIGIIIYYNLIYQRRDNRSPVETMNISKKLALAAVLVGPQDEEELAFALGDEQRVTDPYFMQAAPEGGVDGRVEFGLVDLDRQLDLVVVKSFDRAGDVARPAADGGILERLRGTELMIW